jgi:hypothetical protein
MLIVLDNGRNAPVAYTAGLWQRLAARILADRLDRELAAGASPDSSPMLALRAQVLVGTRFRRGVAAGAQRILDAAAGRRLPVPVSRSRVRASSAELSELIRKLVAPGPVSAQGVAAARTLLTDACGPIFQQDCCSDLRASVRAVIDVLDPVGPEQAGTG